MEKEKPNNYLLEPEKLADKTANKIVELLGKTAPVRKIRSSQIASAIIGISGFALVVDGVGKVFYFLPGWGSIILGILLLAISGALLKLLSKDANWW